MFFSIAVIKDGFTAINLFLRRILCSRNRCSTSQLPQAQCPQESEISVYILRETSLMKTNCLGGKLT